MKCNKEVGSFVHTVWTCVHIQDFWVEVALKLDLVFNKKPGPSVLVVGITTPTNKSISLSETVECFNMCCM